MLNDRERELFAQIEQSLRADEDLSHVLRPGVRFRAVGVLAFLAGFALIIAGVSTTWVVLGVVGFALALAGTYVALRGFSPRLGEDPSPDQARFAPRSSSRSSFSQRMEQRWRRRQEGQ